MQDERQTSKTYVKVRGTAWLLQDIDNQPARLAEGDLNIKADCQRMSKQNKKWKKNVSNRFQGFNKKIQKFIEFKFQKENDNFKQFQFQSLRKTESSMVKYKVGAQNATFHQERKRYQAMIFGLTRKQKDLQNQISKMSKLKGTTKICEQKKNFYDNCVDQYFDNYKKQINKSITRLADRSTRCSKIEIGRT